MKNNSKTPELPGMGKSGKSQTSQTQVVNSRERTYKGGRVLPCATRFRYWRTTEGYSLTKIAGRLEEKTREFGMDDHYLLTRLMELEQGRFKPPTWLVSLLSETYGIKFPWWEFYDGVKP